MNINRIWSMPNKQTFWSKIKDDIARVLKPSGRVICFGWNSNGCGKTRGFELEEVLLVPHGGGNHNDTIVTVERKIKL